MSRVANNPVPIPDGVNVAISDKNILVKGAKGELSMTLHQLVEILQEEGKLTLRTVENSKTAKALAGTFRSLVNNMVLGVSTGFAKELELQGVGYRAQLRGKTLNLSLGFSHPVKYEIPEGVDIETPSQTRIIVKGINKQLVGQVSAEIRAFKPPEPYKGKGVRYLNEYVKRKEAKKK